MTLSEAAAICHDPWRLTMPTNDGPDDTALREKARFSLAHVYGSAARAFAGKAADAYASGDWNECIEECVWAVERAEDMLEKHGR